MTSLIEAARNPYHQELIEQYPDQCHRGRPCLHLSAETLGITRQVMDGDMTAEEGQQAVAEDAKRVRLWCQVGQTSMGCSGVPMCNFAPGRNAALIEGLAK